VAYFYFTITTNSGIKSVSSELTREYSIFIGNCKAGILEAGLDFEEVILIPSFFMQTMG